jgi:hypothetical protein
MGYLMELFSIKLENNPKCILFAVSVRKFNKK